MKSKISELFSVLCNSNLKQKNFLTLSNRSVTYQKFIHDLDILNASEFFSSLPYQSKLIISSEDDYSKILLFFFALRKGLVSVILDPNTNINRVGKLVEDIQPEAWVLDVSLLSKWPYDPETTLKIDERKNKKQFFKKLLKKEKNNDENTQKSLNNILDAKLTDSTYSTVVDSEALAYILYTSGSTSDPKGVMISHDNLFYHLSTLVEVYKLNDSSVVMNPLMLEHADGMIQGPLLTAYCQGSLIRTIKFEISKIPEILAAVYKYKVSHFVAVPTIISLIDQFAPSEYYDSFQTDEFRFIISVSSHISSELWKRFEKKYGIRVVNVYGLTETVAGSFFCGPSNENYKQGTIGKPIDLEAKIVNAQGDVCEVNQQGELLVKGRHITSGYFKNNSATKVLFDQEWMRTGDLAIVDNEGFFSIVGRIKNIVISGGFNIHPEEVQEILLLNSNVETCVCFGITDSSFGERLIATYTSNTAYSPYELEEYANKSLEPEKVPSKFIQLEILPMGISGKVDLPRLKKIISEMLKEQTTPYENIEEGVKKAASHAFNKPIEYIETHHTSQNLEGWDSLAHLDFITKIESVFDIKLKTSHIITMNSIQTSINIVTNALIK